MPVGSHYRLLQPRVLVVGLLVILFIRAVVAPSPAEANELLLNGSFQSVMGWSGFHFAVPGTCAGRTGNAGTLSPDISAFAVAQQDVKINGGAGPFTLTGYVKLQAGEATVRPVIRWLDAGGTEILTTAPPDDLFPDATYRFFSTLPATAPLKAVTAQIRTTALANVPATVCVDDFSFAGPAVVQPPPTSVPPDIPLPTATDTRTPTPTRTPRPTSTPTETHTPRPTHTPTETHTPRPTNEPTETHTPRPTITPTETHTPEPTDAATATRAPLPRTAATGAAALSAGATGRATATRTAARGGTGPGRSSGTGGGDVADADAGVDDTGDSPTDGRMGETSADSEAGAAGLAGEVAEVSDAVEAPLKSESRDWVLYSVAGFVIVLGGLALGGNFYLRRHRQ